MRWRSRHRRILVSGVALALSTSACAWWPATQPEGEPPLFGVDLSVETSEQIGEIELRMRLQRFADTFIQETWQEMELIDVADTDLDKRYTLVLLRYAYGWAPIAIASGPDSNISLLDLMVFLTLARGALEDHWVPEVFGPSARPLLESVRGFEEAVWSWSETQLSAQHRRQLRRRIDEWRAANPDRNRVEAVRFNSLAAALPPDAAEEMKGLLADVRKAAAAADTAVDLGERITFFFQRAPILWRMHAQLAFFEIVGQPELQKILDDGERVSAAAERLSRNFEVLMSALTNQPPNSRQAELFAHLDEGETRLRRLLDEARQTVEATNELARNTHALAVRLNIGGSTREGSRPFDITEYASVAGDVSVMAGELRRLSESMSALLASERLDGASRTVDDLLSAAMKLAGITIVTLAAWLTLFLAYRILSSRWAA